MQLSDDHVEIVEKLLVEQGVNYEPLYHELLDHLCCEIEILMSNENSFQEALQIVREIVKKGLLKNIETETLHNLNYTITTMKKLMLGSAILSAIGIIIGLFLKAMHWPGANILLLIGTTSVSLGFLPAFFVFLIKTNEAKQNKLMYLTGVLTPLLLIMGSLFKSLHWPGANIIFVLGSIILAFGFLPSYFYYLFQNQEVRKNKVMYLAAFLCPFLMSIGMTLKFMHWPGSLVFNVAGLIFLVFGFLPLYFLQSYKSGASKAGSMALVLILLIAVPIIFNILNPKSSNAIKEAVAGLVNRDQQLAELYGRKNQEAYHSLFVIANATENAQLTNDAKLLSEKADELCMHLDELRHIAFVDSNPHQKGIDVTKMENLLSIGTTEAIFIHNGEAKKLKNKLIEFETILSSLSQRNNRKSASYVQFFLETNGESWETAHFQDKPVIDVLAFLSQIQTAVRAAENETITTLILREKVKKAEIREESGI